MSRKKGLPINPEYLEALFIADAADSEVAHSPSQCCGCWMIDIIIKIWLSANEIVAERWTVKDREKGVHALHVYRHDLSTVVHLFVPVVWLGDGRDAAQPLIHIIRLREY